MLMYFKKIISCFVLTFWGEQTNAFIILHFFVFVEIVMFIMHELSKKGRKLQLIKKKVFQLMSIYLLIGLGNIIDKYFFAGVGFSRNTLICYYIIFECKLIVGNLPIPVPREVVIFISLLKTKINL